MPPDVKPIDLNHAKLEEFGGRAIDILNKAAVAVMMSVGHRTRLFETLATLPPSTPSQIAEAALLDQVASALKRGGTFLMWDVAASSDLQQNKDHVLGSFLYATSCMHCMTVSLAQDGEGLGAMWGREKATAMLERAGLADVQVYRVEDDPVNCCYVAKKP